MLLSTPYEKVHKHFPVFFRLICFPYAIPLIFLRTVTLGRVQIPFKYRYALLGHMAKRCRAEENKCSEVASQRPEFSDKKSIHLLWFGNAGVFGTYGISDISLVQEDLNALHQTHPLTLTIISNDCSQFLKLQSSLAFPCRYISWNLEIVYDMASQFDCVILPNPLNEFSRGKSANRTLLSLSLGVPVVATRTEELEKLRDCISFGDWKNSILRYVTDFEFKQEHLKNYQTFFAQSPHNPRIVWDKWYSCLRSLIKP